MYVSTFVILLIVMSSIIGLLYAVIALYKAQKVEETKLLLESNESYYHNLDHQVAQVRKIRHDMVNHLQVIAGLKENQVTDYVNELLSSRALSEPMVFCRDAVINALLSVKRELFVSNGIKFRYEVSLEDSVFLSDIDKCALLGNLLDNAMEGTMKAEGKKVVDLRINCAKGLFVVQIRNTYNGKLKDGLKTSKYDSLNHGFGLASVREVIERNHGTIKVNAESTEAIQECTDPIFEVFIVIPMKETN